MSINISPRTDYSALFSSLSTSKHKSGSASWMFGGNATTGVNLSDYASIKNGSYGKLLKSYYSQDSSAKTSATAAAAKKIIGNSKDATSVNSTLSKETDALSKSASALATTGKDSVFEKKEIVSKDENGVESKTTDYDRDAIYKAVSSFAKDYNQLLETAEQSNNNSVRSTATNMINQTAVYKKALSEMGISVGDDNKLTVDKEKLDKADVNSIKKVFSGNGGLADMTKNRSDMIASSAQSDALKAAGLYGSTGSYTNTSLFNGGGFTGLF
ncbi:MAG: hypothetical protein K5739_00180 [Lachnospiraceae bacterium]|nr:hypothetical protein [Lachnospiraceae bacterium]